MKIRILLALVGLAIGFPVPILAQQKDTVDPKIIEQLAAIGNKADEAFNNGDAAALAALYTEDAVLVNEKGPIYGRESIEKYYARLFQYMHFANYTSKPDQYSPHIMGTAGNEVWSNGKWNATLQAQVLGTVKHEGYWSSITILEGDTWKKQLDISNWNVVPGTPGNH